MVANEDDLMRRIEREKARLSPTLKSIADFLLVEGTGVGDLSITRLAAVTFTSKPTVVRFAQRFGFAGWKDFRSAFVTSAQHREMSLAGDAGINVNYPFGEDSRAQEVAEGVRQVKLAALERLQRGLDYEALEVASRRLVECRQAIFLGRPPNSYLGKAFAFQLREIGIDCRVPHEEEATQLLEHVGADDCVIAASYSGTISWGPMRFVPATRERGAFVIAITTPHTALAESCDCLLSYDAAEHYYTKITGYFGDESVRQILDSLFGCCYGLNYSKNVEANGALAAQLARSYSISDTL